MTDKRQCEACNIGLDKAYEDNQAILNLLDIIEANDEQIETWERNNPSIDLSGYFCYTCADKMLFIVNNS